LLPYKEEQAVMVIRITIALIVRKINDFDIMSRILSQDFSGAFIAMLSMG
jgi:hypothetical protein